MSDNPLNSKISIDTTDYKTGLTEINRSIRVIESGFRASAAALGDWSESATGLEMRIKALSSEIDLQKRKVDAVRGEYERVRKEKGETSRAAQELQIKLNKENETLNKMQRELDQTTEATKGIVGGLKKVDESAGQASKRTNLLKGSLTELNSAIGVVKEGLAIAGQVVDATVNKFVEYATQVEDLGRNTGITAEETSRLIQVADDLFVEYGSLEQAAKALKENGLRPNIETLAKLSDEYLAIEDPIKRAQFANDKFGKSYQEMTKILEVGGEKIRQAGKDVPKELVFSEKDLQKARDYKEALDNLNDTLQTITISLSRDFIPALTKGVEWTGKAVADLKELFQTKWAAKAEAIALTIDAQTAALTEQARIQQEIKDQKYDVYVEGLKEKIYGLDGAEQIYHDGLLDQVAVQNQATGAIDKTTGSLDKETDASREAAKAIGEKLPGAYKNLEDAQKDWSTKVGENAASALEATGASASKVAEGVGIIDDALGTNIGARDAYELAQKNLAKDFADGKVNGEEYKAKLLELASTYAKDLAPGIKAARDELTKLNSDLDAMNGKQVDVYVSVHEKTVTGGSTSPTHKTPNKTPGPFPEEYASGGLGIVPPGFPNDSYRIGLTSGEEFLVTPPGVGLGKTLARIRRDFNILASGVNRAAQASVTVAGNSDGYGRQLQPAMAPINITIQGVPDKEMDMRRLARYVATEIQRSQQ
jgi:DNA-dependent RNA polymerase auxiliary subunit epsilon